MIGQIDFFNIVVGGQVGLFFNYFYYVGVVLINVIVVVEVIEVFVGIDVCIKCSFMQICVFDVVNLLVFLFELDGGYGFCKFQCVLIYKYLV